MTSPCVTCVKFVLPSQSPFFQKWKKGQINLPLNIFSTLTLRQRLIFHHVHFVYDNFLELKLQDFGGHWTISLTSFFVSNMATRINLMCGQKHWLPNRNDTPSMWSLEIPINICWFISSKSIRFERPRVHRSPNDS